MPNHEAADAVGLVKKTSRDQPHRRRINTPHEMELEMCEAINCSHQQDEWRRGEVFSEARLENAKSTFQQHRVPANQKYIT